MTTGKQAATGFRVTNSLTLADAAAEALVCLADAHYALLDAHQAVTRSGPDDRVPLTTFADLDTLALLLAEGKWQLGCATGDCADFAQPTGSRDEIASAKSILNRVGDDALRLIERIRVGASGELLADERRRLQSDHEIQRFGTAPIVPSICPVVLLTGTWREMGSQYIEQCVEIFGPFVFERPARREFTAEQKREVEAWSEALLRHAPSVFEFALGMADARAGMTRPLSTLQALALWTGWEAPRQSPDELGVSDSLTRSIMSYFGALKGSTASDDPCSGVAAWRLAAGLAALLARLPR